MSDEEWVPLYDEVKVKRSALPTVDPDEIMRRVLTDAFDSVLAGTFDPLQFRAPCSVREVLALALMAAGAQP